MIMRSDKLSCNPPLVLVIKYMPDGLGDHEQTWDCWVLFSYTRHYNERLEICLTASGKAKCTYGGA